MRPVIARALVGINFLIPAGALWWSTITRDLPQELVSPSHVVRMSTLIFFSVIAGLLIFFAQHKEDRKNTPLNWVQKLSLGSLVLTIISHLVLYSFGSVFAMGLWLLSVGVLFAMSFVWVRYEGRDNESSGQALRKEDFLIA